MERKARAVLCAVCGEGLDPEDPRLAPLLTPQRRADLERKTLRADRVRSVCAELALRGAFRLFGAPFRAYTRGERGQPLLDGGLYLSLSHTGDWGLAVLATCPVGLDCETAGRDFTRVRPRLCAAGEQVPDRDLVRLWTAKEAYLKMTGEGLSFPMTRLMLAEGVLCRDGAEAAQIRYPAGPEGTVTALASPCPLPVITRRYPAETALAEALEQSKEQKP